jgi:nucleotide-binding universal stress UspA family protein
MRARVDYRRGSIFEDECDVLVIPCSVSGLVTPEMQQEIRKAGLPLPGAMRDTVILLPSENPYYRAVAYAAVVAGHTTPESIIEEIGSTLGWIAKSQKYTKFSAPVLGTGSGDLPGPAAAALARGFQSTAPESAELWISDRDPEKLKSVAAHLLGLIPPEGTLGTPTRGSTAPVSIKREKSQPTLAGILADELRRGRKKRLARMQASAQTTPVKPAAAAASQRQGVFISYSHADAQWLERLQKHLKPLQRDGVEVWDDTRLRAGERWREEIREALAKTKVAILLISADFLASDFIVTNELPPLLKAAEEDGATILPVIISPCRFTRMDNLSLFQAVNDPAKPLVQMRHANREKVLDDVARAVEDALKR